MIVMLLWQTQVFGTSLSRSVERKYYVIKQKVYPIMRRKECVKRLNGWSMKVTEEWSLLYLVK